MRWSRAYLCVMGILICVLLNIVLSWSSGASALSHAPVILPPNQLNSSPFKDAVKGNRRHRQVNDGIGEIDEITRLHADTLYTVVIDAGSSGSRVYIYKVTKPLEANQLPIVLEVKDEQGKPVSLKMEPGK